RGLSRGQGRSRSSTTGDGCSWCPFELAIRYRCIAFSQAYPGAHPRRARYFAGVTAQISLGWFNIRFYQDLYRIMDSQHSSFQFSQRALQLTSSAIREILKVTTRPEVSSFAGGLPSPERSEEHTSEL